MELKIYIVGAVTDDIARFGIETVRAKFEAAEELIRKSGFQPVNPMKLGIPVTATRQEAWPVCVAAISHCIGIFVLPCWGRGKLTKTEVAYFMENAPRSHRAYMYWNSLPETLRMMRNDFELLTRKKICEKCKNTGFIYEPLDFPTGYDQEKKRCSCSR